MRMGRAIVGVFVLVMLLAACSGTDVAEQIIESQEGVGNIEIDENSGSVVLELEDEEGDTSAVIGGGEIPADFPVPVPAGGTVMAVVTQGNDESASISYPSSEFDSLKSFYANWAAGAGEELATFESSTPPAVSWSIQDGDVAYSVSVSDTGSETFVSIVVVTSSS